MCYKRNKNETTEEYTYRICSMKEQLGSWEAVAKIINEELGANLKADTYRKKYQAFEKFYLGNKNISNIDNNEQIEQLNDKIRELKEARVKLNDERAAYNRLLRDKARNDLIYELLKENIQAFSPPKVPDIPVYEETMKEMVVVLSDIHAGNGAKNAYNEYNNNIMYKRIFAYLEEIKNIQKKYLLKKCHLVLLGDLINGHIHANMRIENKENVVEQIMSVSECISDFVYVLSGIFGEIDIYSVAGNHSRLSPNKSEHLKGENLDVLIPFYMKARLANLYNIVFYENTIDESIGSFEICGRTAYFVHGDKDTTQNVVQNLTLMTGSKPDYVFMGHRHTNRLTTEYDTKIIESGCLSGSDSYCMDHRLRNKPEQAVAICDKNGLYRLYDVKFD